MSRKYVLQKQLQEDVEPPGEGQHIVMAVGSRGSNIMEVRAHSIDTLATSECCKHQYLVICICSKCMQCLNALRFYFSFRRFPHRLFSFILFVLTCAQVQFPDGRRTLCLLPAKFHKKVWIKRGNYLIIESMTAEVEAAVTGQIIHVLYADHVKQLKKSAGVWPVEFDGKMSLIEGASSDACAGLAAELDQLNLGAPVDVEENEEENEEEESEVSGAPKDDDVDVGEEGSAKNVVVQNSDIDRNTTNQVNGGGGSFDDSSSSSDDDLPPIQKFQNRRVIQYEVSESESEDDD